LKNAILFLWLACFCLPVQAAIETYEFDSAEMEADYKQLVEELRCLVCQNQNLAGSDADLARDLRHETYEMLQQGKTKQQVIDFMVARYGEFVLYRPKFETSTYLLWLGPFLLLVAVLVAVIRRLRATSRPAEVDAASLAEAKQLLESNEPRQ